MTNKNSWSASAVEAKKPASVKGDLRLEYPLPWKHLLEVFRVVFDAEDMPLELVADGTRRVVNPEIIALYGLQQVTLFLREGNIRARFYALRMADWLVENLLPWQENFFTWPLQPEMSDYAVDQPYASVKMQGLALSLLLRTAYLNNDATYEEAASRAVRLFFLPVEEGGIARCYPDGSVVFETCRSDPPTLPLPGLLIGLIGLYEYAAYFDDRSTRSLFLSALDSLKNILTKYDTGRWLLGDLHPTRRLASPETLDVITDLLAIIRQISEDEYFDAVIAKWRKYRNTSSLLVYYRANKLVEKIRLRIFAHRLGVGFANSREGQR